MELNDASMARLIARLFGGSGGRGPAAGARRTGYRSTPSKRCQHREQLREWCTGFVVTRRCPLELDHGPYHRL